MTDVRGYHSSIYGACGVGVVDGFGYRGTSITSKTVGGASWICAGFINNKLCKKAYVQMSNKFKLVYQTPVRRNSNSGHDFFFAIFDTLGSGVPTGFNGRVM